jgi:hypothetical protein
VGTAVVEQLSATTGRLSGDPAAVPVWVAAVVMAVAGSSEGITLSSTAAKGAKQGKRMAGAGEAAGAACLISGYPMEPRFMITVAAATAVTRWAIGRHPAISRARRATSFSSRAQVAKVVARLKKIDFESRLMVGFVRDSGHHRN